KAFAFLRGRGYVTPQDVKSIGMDVLRHRVSVTYEAEAEEKTSETIITKIFNELPVPSVMPVRLSFENDFESHFLARMSFRRSAEIWSTEVPRPGFFNASSARRSNSAISCGVSPGSYPASTTS